MPRHIHPPVPGPTEADLAPRIPAAAGAARSRTNDRGRAQPAAAAPNGPGEDDPTANWVLLAGTLSSDPVVSLVQSGATLARFALRVRDDTRMTSIPITWWEPRAQALRALHQGVGVVVLARLRRRFRSIGDAKQSTIDIIAIEVVKASRPAAVDRLMTHAIDTMRDAHVRLTGLP